MKLYPLEKIAFLVVGLPFSIGGIVLALSDRPDAVLGYAFQIPLIALTIVRIWGWIEWRKTKEEPRDMV